MWKSAYELPPVVPRRLTSFAVIGVICTAAFTALYSWFRTFADPIEANAGALSLTMLVNFVANRRFTFNAHQQPVLPQLAGYLVVYLVGMGASTATLFLALHAFNHPSSHFETVLALASGAVATIVRFVLLSSWVFTTPAVSPPGQAPAPSRATPARGHDSR